MTTKLEHNGPVSIVEQASSLLMERRTADSNGGGKACARKQAGSIVEQASSLFIGR